MNCIDLLNTKSTPAMISAKISEVTITTTALFCSSLHVGHVTLCNNSVYESLKYSFIFFIFSDNFRTGGETRTPDTWFWRPVLYQLSYTRVHGCKARRLSRAS